jgi:hypothetical protein
MFYDDDDGFDGRNAVSRRRVVVRPRPRPVIGVGVSPRAPMYGYPQAPPYGYPQAPWEQPTAPPPVVDRYTGGLKLGLILDAAAQALAAMASLPSAPPVVGDQRADTQNLVKYQESLAQHAKRDEQIRTVGALARLFLV